MNPRWVRDVEDDWYPTPASFPTLLKRGLTTTQALVLHLLLVTDGSDPDPDGWIDVRQEEIAEFAGQQVDSIQAVIKTLADGGLIERRRIGRKNVYRIDANNWKDWHPEQQPELK